MKYSINSELVAMWVDFLISYKTNSVFVRDSLAIHKETPRDRFNKKLPSLTMLWK